MRETGGVKDGARAFDVSSGSTELPLTDTGEVMARMVVVRICGFSFVFYKRCCKLRCHSDTV